MSRVSKIGTASLALLLALGLAACNQLKARDQLNKGVRAYRDQRYTVAVDHFKKAVELDPNLINARLYLGTAYAMQYIPGAQSEENKRMGQEAINTFLEVLRMDPNNLSSVAGIASIYFQMGDFEKANEFYRKRIEIEPNNPEPYYSIGVVNWTMSYKMNQEIRNNLNNLPPKEPLPVKERDQFRAKHWDMIEEGIQKLLKAVELNPQYGDAMAYINLSYRQRADMQADKAAREKDIAEADRWFEKAKELKFKQESKEAATTETPQQE